MRVHTIGSIALQQLQQAQGAAVIGRSSRGVFIRLDSAWVIFLAWEGVPGPLTLNLQGTTERIRDDLPDGELLVTPVGLVFPPPTGLIALDEALLWLAPEPDPDPNHLLSPAGRRLRLGEIARQARALRPGAGWSALLPDPDGGLEELSGIPGGVLPAIRDLQIALQRNDTVGLDEALARLIGLGSGLTPSGDDLALGLLLAASRWGGVLRPAINREQLAALVVKRARQATTGLSASLIATAAQGQADPRLIAALDSILTGQPDVAEIAAGLADWGSSSGLDALLGMSLVI